jgi:hypothetical protein
VPAARRVAADGRSGSTTAHRPRLLRWRTIDRSVEEMATNAEAQDAVLGAIVDAVSRQASGADVRDLAEAYAWLVSQAQPHGGSIFVQQ